MDCYYVGCVAIEGDHWEFSIVAGEYYLVAISEVYVLDFVGAF